MTTYVLDTDVMVAAVRSRHGASRQLVRSALERRLRIALSVPLLLEYEAVLTRPDHMCAAGGSVTDVLKLLDAVAAVAVPVTLAFLWRPQLRDPNDDMVLETAVNAGASVVVTFNQRDFRGLAERFAIAVRSPRDALAEWEGRV